MWHDLYFWKTGLYWNKTKISLTMSTALSHSKGILPSLTAFSALRGYQSQRAASPFTPRSLRVPSISKYNLFFIFIYTKNLTAPAVNRTEGFQIYLSVLWPLRYWDTARTIRNFHIYWIGHDFRFSNRKTSHLHNVEWSLSGDFLK